MIKERKERRKEKKKRKEGKKRKGRERKEEKKKKRRRREEEKLEFPTLFARFFPKKNCQKVGSLPPPTSISGVTDGDFLLGKMSPSLLRGRSFTVINQVPRSSSLVFTGSLHFRSLQPTRSDLHSHRIIQGSQVPTNFRFPSTVPPSLPLLQLINGALRKGMPACPVALRAMPPHHPPF